MSNEKIPLKLVFIAAIVMFGTIAMLGNEMTLSDENSVGDAMAVLKERTYGGGATTVCKSIIKNEMGFNGRICIQEKNLNTAIITATWNKYPCYASWPSTKLICSNKATGMAFGKNKYNSKGDYRGEMILFDQDYYPQTTKYKQYVSKSDLKNNCARVYIKFYAKGNSPLYLQEKICLENTAN